MPIALGQMHAGLRDQRHYKGARRRQRGAGTSRPARRTADFRRTTAGTHGQVATQRGPVEPPGPRLHWTRGRTRTWWPGSSPGGMGPRSRPWSTGTGPRSSGSADGCSGTCTRPRTPFRPRSWPSPAEPPGSATGGRGRLAVRGGRPRVAESPTTIPPAPGRGPAGGPAGPGPVGGDHRPGPRPGDRRGGGPAARAGAGGPRPV